MGELRTYIGQARPALSLRRKRSLSTNWETGFLDVRLHSSVVGASSPDTWMNSNVYMVFYALPGVNSTNLRKSLAVAANSPFQAEEGPPWATRSQDQPFQSQPTLPGPPLQHTSRSHPSWHRAAFSPSHPTATSAVFVQAARQYESALDDKSTSGTAVGSDGLPRGCARARLHLRGATWVSESEGSCGMFKCFSTLATSLEGVST